MTIKTDFFINFMKELKDLDFDNKKYYMSRNIVARDFFFKKVITTINAIQKYEKFIF